jgi:hypothetical protein
VSVDRAVTTAGPAAVPIEEHGFAEYGKWHLGVDDEEAEGTKSRYKFPYGDFERVHLCGVLGLDRVPDEYGAAHTEGAGAG